MPRRGEDRRFRAIVESAAVGIAVAGLDARIVETNPMLREMLGYTERELLGMSIREFTHHEDAERNLELFAELVGGSRDLYQLEKRYVRKDGSVFWGRVNTSLVRDEDGRPELVVATIEDVDARRETEAKLAEAETRYRTLVEQLPLVTYIDAADEVSSNIYTSPQIESVLGYTVDEWRADRELFVKLLHPDDRDRVLREMAEATAAGGRFTSEYRLVARNGRIVWFRDESVPIQDAHGLPVYDQGYLLDITQRKAAEEALRESEERFRSMADEAPVLVWTTDDHGRVTFFSRGWLEFTGRTPGQELGFGWLDGVHPDDAEQAVDSYLKAIQAREPWEALYRLRRKDGAYRWIEDRGRPRILADGTLAGYVGVGIDVTDRRQAEQALVRRDAVLEAVAGLAEQLLRGVPWQQVDLGELGRAARVSRVYLFEKRPAPGDAVVMSQRREWVGDGVVALLDDPVLEEFDLTAMGFAEWIAPLSRGQIIHSHLRNAPEGAKAELARQGIQSVLLVPILVEGAWWGLVGVDECESERVWTEGEIEALRAAAGILGETIARERAARSLREATELLELVVSASPAAITAFDTQGHVIMWNRTAEEMFGWTRDEVIGRFNPFVTDETRPEFLAYLERGLAGDSWSNVELRRVRKDGSEIDLLAASAPVRNADGEIVGLASVLQDVTREKRVQDALRESEARFAAFMNNAQALAWMKDDEGRYVYANERWEHVTGRAAAEISGRTDLELFPENAASYREADERVRAGGTPVEQLDTLVDSRGEARTFLALKFPFTDPAGGRYVGGVAFDVTEREQTETALAETSRALRAIVDSSPLAIIAFDREGLVTSWNEAAERMFGWAPDEVLGRPNPLLRPEDAEQFREALAGALAGRSRRGTEVTRIRKEGTPLDVSLSSAPLLDASGSPIGMVVMLADVSERTRAEAALRESEERYRTLVANVPGAIYRCAPDVSWTMAVMSDAVAEITGHPASDFIGNAVRSYASVIHEDDREAVAQTVDDALARGEPFSLQYRIRHADGSVRWVAEDGRPVFGADGTALWLDGVIFDVTAERHALNDRARTQVLLDSVVEHIPTALFVKDAAELRFVRLNRAAEDLFGYAREDALGKSDRDLFPPAQAASFVAKDRDVLGDHVLADIPEEPIEVQGGETRYLHTRKVPIRDEEGRPIYLLGISEDITDRKRAEEEREAMVSALAAQNVRLRELDGLKDEFVALVSHELRTPLTSILGYLELVLDEEAGGLTDEQRHFLSIVERNSNRLLRLVGDLLFVAQIEAGRLAIDREQVDLGTIAGDCVEAAKPHAAEKGIELRLDACERADLEGDRTRLAQLFDNLVSNAIKFTEQGGRVDVRVERRNGARVVTVTDTGIGLDRDELTRLFERFYRSAGATRRAIQGTGLGLTITKAIAEAHGGSIAVESERGVGTTFTVELPARPKEPRAADS